MVEKERTVAIHLYESGCEGEAMDYSNLERTKGREERNPVYCLYLRGFITKFIAQEREK
jgi:hypothetical protein